jgi:hypothetical protein
MTAGLLFPKCVGLTLREDRKAKRAAVVANERAVERAVLARDGKRCRVPGCRTDGECAHVAPKGMGGDHGERTDTGNCFRCCPEHHRGPRGSIHSTHLEVIKLTPAGCDGPLAFHWRQTGSTVKEKS